MKKFNKYTSENDDYAVRWRSKLENNFFEELKQ